MSMEQKESSLIVSLAAGVAAGAIGGIVQPAVGKLDEILFFPPDEDTDIPRHLVSALTRRAGSRLPASEELLVATLFHIGYAFFWGAAYGGVVRSHRVSPLLGGLALGGVLYTAAFSRIGIGTLVGSEPPPGKRRPRQTALTIAMPLVFGLTTAAVFDVIQKRITSPR
jgi:hypothetical protein